MENYIQNLLYDKQLKHLCHSNPKAYAFYHLMIFNAIESNSTSFQISQSSFKAFTRQEVRTILSYLESINLLTSKTAKLTGTIITLSTKQATKGATKQATKETPSETPIKPTLTEDVKKSSTKQATKEPTKEATKQIDIKERYLKFVNYINMQLGRKLHPLDKNLTRFKNRLSHYGPEVLVTVVQNLKASDHHQNNSYRYCTVEFILREDTIEKYKDRTIAQMKDKAPQAKSNMPELPSSLTNKNVIS